MVSVSPAPIAAAVIFHKYLLLDVGVEAVADQLLKLEPDKTPVEKVYVRPPFGAAVVGLLALLFS